MTRAIFVLVFAAFVLAVPPAPAAPRAEGPPEPLLAAPGTDLETARRLAVGPVGDPMLLDDLVRDAVGSVARLYGASQVVTCRGAPLAPGTLPQVVADADRFILELEYERADTILQTAAAALACAEHLVARAPLSELFFLLGVSASYAGDAERAQRWFGQALAVSPNRSFDTTLAPRVYEQYLVAMERHYVGSPVPVALALGATEAATIYIDGATVDPKGELPTLGDGFHFLQFRRQDGPVVTFEFRVDPGDAIALATPEGALEAAILGPAAPEALQGIVAAVFSGAAGRGATGTVQLVDGKTVRRFLPATQEWETLREPPDRITRIRQTGRTLVGAGLGLLGFGVALSVASAVTAPEHPTHPDYPRSLAANRVGISLSVIGLGVGGFGLPLVIAARPAREERRALRPTAAVGFSAGPDGFTLTFGGTL